MNRLQGLTAAVTAGLGLAIGGAVKVAVDFEHAMTRLKALTGATNQEMKALSATAKELGQSTEFSAVQVAEGMREFLQAGASVEETVKSIGVAIDLSTATFTDLGEAADIITNIMTPFGVSIDNVRQVADQLTTAANSASTNFTMLGQSFKNVAGVAASTGLSIADTAALIDTLAEAGIKGAQAGTSLSSMLTRLASPTSKAIAVFDRLGVTLEKNEDGTLDAISIFRQLADANLTTADAVEIFEREQAKAALAVTDNLDVFERVKDAIDGSNGSLKKNADTARSDTVGAFNKLKSAALGLANTIFGPLLKSLTILVNFLTSVLQTLSSLAERFPLITTVVLGTTTVITALGVAISGLITFVGSVVSLLPAFHRGLEALKDAYRALKDALFSTDSARDNEIIGIQEEIQAHDRLQWELQQTIELRKQQAHATRQAAGSRAGGPQTVLTPVPTTATGAGTTAPNKGGRLRGALSKAGKVAGSAPALIGISLAANQAASSLGKVNSTATTIAGTLGTVGAVASAIPHPIAQVAGKVALVGSALVPAAAAFLGFGKAAEKGAQQATESLDKHTERLIQESVLWDESFSEFYNRFKDVWSDDVALKVEKRWKEVYDSMKGAPERALKELADTSKMTAGEIAATMGDLSTGIAGETQETGKELADSLSQYWDDTVDIADRSIEDGLKRIQQDFKNFERYVTEDTEISSYGNAYNKVFNGISNVVTSTSERLGAAVDRMSSQLRHLGDDKGGLEQMGETFKKVATAGVEAFEKLRDEVGKNLDAMRDKHAEVLKQIEDLERSHKDELRDIRELESDAIRAIQRRSLTDEQKYYETRSYLRQQLAEANQLLSTGEEEDYRRGQQILKEVVQTAKSELTAVTEGSGEQAAVLVSAAQAQKDAVDLVTRATLTADTAAKAYHQTQLKSLQEEKDLYADQIKKLTRLQAETQKLLNQFKQKVRLAIDTSELQEVLSQDRVINARLSITNARELGLQVPGRRKGGIIGRAAGGGTLPGYGGGDRRLYLLEDGEGVIRKEAVKAFGGSRFVDAVNSLSLKIPKMAAGGVAGGSPVSAGALNYLKAILGYLDEIPRELQPIISMFETTEGRLRALHSAAYSAGTSAGGTQYQYAGAGISTGEMSKQDYLERAGARVRQVTAKMREEARKDPEQILDEGEESLKKIRASFEEQRLKERLRRWDDLDAAPTSDQEGASSDMRTVLDKLNKNLEAGVKLNVTVNKDGGVTISGGNYNTLG